MRRLKLDPVTMTVRTSPEMLAVLFNVADLRRRVLSLQPATQSAIEGYRRRVSVEMERRLRSYFDADDLCTCGHLRSSHYTGGRCGDRDSYDCPCACPSFETADDQ